MPSSPSDPDLIAALALHYDDLVDYLRRRFRRQDFARDLVHDVCVQVLEKPPAGPVKLPFAFLRRTAFNRGIDKLRSERRQHALLSDPRSVQDHSDDWDGLRALDFERQLTALLAIIDALPARQRQVFLLHRIHAMAQRDIATELGISTNMVTQHFTRAMGTIAQRWEPARRACA